MSCDSGNETDGYEGWSDTSTVAYSYSIPSGYGSNGVIDDFMLESACTLCHIGPHFDYAMKIEIEFLQSGNCYLNPPDDAHNPQGIVMYVKCKR